MHNVFDNRAGPLCKLLRVTQPSASPSSLQTRHLSHDRGGLCSDTSQITAKQSTSYFSNFRAAEHYYGYPFRAAVDSMQDFTLHDQEDSDRLFLPPSNEADPRIGKRSPLQPSPFPRRTEPVFCLWRPSERSASGKPQLRHGRCHSIQTNARRVTTVGFTSTNRK